MLGIVRARVALLAALLALVACSSSFVTSEPEIVPVGDAGTDALADGA